MIGIVLFIPHQPFNAVQNRQVLVLAASSNQASNFSFMLLILLEQFCLLHP